MLRSVIVVAVSEPWPVVYDPVPDPEWLPSSRGSVAVVPCPSLTFSSSSWMTEV